MKVKLIKHNTEHQFSFGGNEDTRKFLKEGSFYECTREVHAWHTYIIINGNKFNSVCFWQPMKSINDSILDRAKEIEQFVGRKWCSVCESYCHECGCNPSISAKTLMKLATHQHKSEIKARLEELNNFGDGAMISDRAFDWKHNRIKELEGLLKK